MKTELRHAVACAVLSALSAHPVLAAEGSAKSPPQDRKAACTQEARGLKAADRDDFMSWCLKQDAATVKQAKATEPGSQQDRMRKCNAQAKDKALKGQERRSFMSACLKG